MPYLSKIKWVELPLLSFGKGHDLNLHAPRGVVTGLDGIIQITSSIVGIWPRQLVCLGAAQVLNSLVTLEKGQTFFVYISGFVYTLLLRLMPMKKDGRKFSKVVISESQNHTIYWADRLACKYMAWFQSETSSKKITLGDFQAPFNMNVHYMFTLIMLINELFNAIAGMAYFFI